MAVKYAVANGNWNAGATWNGGVVPTIDDDVYLNGYNVTLPNSGYTALAHLVTNGYFAQTGNSGGSISGGQNQTIVLPTGASVNAQVKRMTANVMADGVPIFTGGNIHMRVVIVGNVTANAQLTDNNGSYSRGVYVTGNIVANSYIVGNGSVSEIDCVGNVTANYNLAVSATVFVNIFGNLACFVTQTIGLLSINGSITYESTDNTIGTIYTKLNILNPDTFTWKDITEPRVNPFIILTDAEMNNRQQYPLENEVKQGTEYVWGQKVGTYLPDYPPESVVLQGYEYDNGDMVGNMAMAAQVGCVTKEDVREGVALIGMDEVGTLVVPSVDDVREGVVFDNGSVGTLIVQGGGERLRIADFGYYTRSTSITYIVDLTESDKPAFADCEEIVLRSLFPTLDLDNIPDKFFDDLFIQFLRYRLLVEYYRGTSINSKFTPSEPTTEIVNYANTKCEYWLNTANLFLQLWGEKYPNSVKKDRILL